MTETTSLLPFSKSTYQFVVICLTRQKLKDDVFYATVAKRAQIAVLEKIDCAK